MTVLFLAVLGAAIAVPAIFVLVERDDDDMAEELTDEQERWQ